MTLSCSTFTFLAHSFSKASGELVLEYLLDDRYHFRELLVFPVDGVEWEAVDKEALSRVFDAIHLAGGVSYYKCCCPKDIKTAGAALSEMQAQFWNAFYTKGLGEFFYSNKIDPRGLVNFPCSSALPRSPKEPVQIIEQAQLNALIPIGGGKDSIVTAEILKRAGMPYTLFSLNDPDPIRATAEIVGGGRLIVKRTLSPLLFEINKQGALNDHIPITGYLSLIATAVAIMHGCTDLVMSLEKSANFPQAIGPFGPVNHQYSKSEEFESALAGYMAYYITPDINYFSILRPFYEIKIASLFARFAAEEPRYLKAFTSCNRNFRQDSTDHGCVWCGECPKCAFVFAVLAPFIAQHDIVQLFGGNLFDRETLVPLYRSLLGRTESLPFECVGMKEETQAALWKASQMEGYSDTPVIKFFREEVLPSISDPESLYQDLLSCDTALNIPKQYRRALKQWER